MGICDENEEDHLEDTEDFDLELVVFVDENTFLDFPWLEDQEDLNLAIGHHSLPLLSVYVSVYCHQGIVIDLSVGLFAPLDENECKSEDKDQDGSEDCPVR